MNKSMHAPLIFLIHRHPGQVGTALLLLLLLRHRPKDEPHHLKKNVLKEK